MALEFRGSRETKEVGGNTQNYYDYMNVNKAMNCANMVYAFVTSEAGTYGRYTH